MSEEKKILDSGERRQFASGAVRDIQEGKGRCDLLPLVTVGNLLSYSTEYVSPAPIKPEEAVNNILAYLDAFTRNGKIDLIYLAICQFIDVSDFESVTNAILEVSKHYEEGAKKYCERNWEKGIDCHAYIDSGVRHLLKWLGGWDDEPHDRAFLWNMLGLIWTVDNHPECNDLLYAKNKLSQNKEENPDV